jgi:hypothetical protein
MPKVASLEVWKSIPGFPGYEVSNCNRVRSYWKRIMLGYPLGSKMVLASTPKFLTVSFDGQELRTAIGTGYESKTFRIAHLVLLAFDRPPKPGEVARHYHDPDPYNCKPENLRWGTSAENSADITRHYGKHSRAKLTAMQVVEIRKRLATGNETQRSLAKEYGVSEGTITYIKQGKVGKTVPDLTDEQPVPSNWAEQGE